MQDDVFKMGCRELFRRDNSKGEIDMKEWYCVNCGKELDDDKNECFGLPDDIEIFCKKCFKAIFKDKLYCGDCNQLKIESEMWSDFTCKKCASDLGLNAYSDENIYGM